MASIVKRKSKYSVVYTYKDDKGEKRQKWETLVVSSILAGGAKSTAEKPVKSGFSAFFIFAQRQ